jgi:hypothetical protein
MMIFLGKFRNKTEMKKGTVIFRHHVSLVQPCLQVYRIMGVATAAGTEDLPKAPGA